MNGILICAMLQPDPNLLDLFDNCVILEKGRVLYSGETKFTIDFFSSLEYYNILI